MKRDFFAEKSRCRKRRRFTFDIKNGTLTAFAPRTVGLFYNKFPLA